MTHNFNTQANSEFTPAHSVLLAALLGDIYCRHTRQFLASVLAEPEMAALVFAPESRIPKQLLIQVLQRAARTSTAWCALARAQSDVLYAATVMQGLHMRLHRFVFGKTDVADVLFTLVHPALRRLDDESPLTARLMRELMGWGNWDEMNELGEGYLPQMQHAMARALKAVMGQGGAQGESSQPTTSPSSFKIAKTSAWRGH